MKKITKAAIAAGIGAVLLVGGTGTIAYWTDTQAGESVTIASGNLDLGTITDGSGWFLQQNASGVTPPQAAPVAYTNQLVVPGDVLTKTVDVPVTLAGANLKATLAVTAATAPSNDLASSLVVEVVSVAGGASPATLTPASVTGGTVPVAFKVTVPWGDASAASQLNKNLSTNFTAQYTLTQVPVATTP